jgi:motility quorum-sensing regulator/GCU-specific mRNA interferase toxin
MEATFSALAGGSAMGFDFDGIVEVVMTLVPADFHKSMTTYADHRIWQDVYHAATDAGVAYLQLTVINEVLIVSFKEM